MCLEERKEKTPGKGCTLGGRGERGGKGGKCKVRNVLRKSMNSVGGRESCEALRGMKISIGM